MMDGKVVLLGFVMAACLGTLVGLAGVWLLPPIPLWGYVLIGLPMGYLAMLAASWFVA